MPPATHSGAESTLQARIWRKFWLKSPRGVTATTKVFRPICKPEYAHANSSACPLNPSGIATASNRLASITNTSTSRTGTVSGSNHLVIHVV
jgi:hypothetical protein